MKLQIKVRNNEDKYMYFLRMTSFIHKLADRGQRVMVALLLEREYLMKQTNNNVKLTRELLFSSETRKKICAKLSIDKIQFTNNVMTELRAKNVIQKYDGFYDINPKLLLNTDDKSIIFEFKEVTL